MLIGFAKFFKTCLLDTFVTMSDEMTNEEASESDDEDMKNKDQSDSDDSDQTSEDDQSE